MANRWIVLALLTAVVIGGAACGKEIGDACNVSTDCSPDGDRLCDPASVGGYCTIPGCDFDTCPGEAVCVRFFTSDFSNRPCNDTAECQLGRPPNGADPGYAGSLDEVCAVSGHCVARSSEIRYCMKTCGSSGDCRDDYECRDLGLMMSHGGEPVPDPDPDAPANSDVQKFCAAKPRSPS